MLSTLNTKISIIGTGNVATILGKLFKQNNFIINEVIGRNEAHTSNLAQLLSTDFSTDLKAIKNNSDVYLITVSDSAIEEVATQLNHTEKIIAHTCGSVSKNVLQHASENFGVLYPLQSLRKEVDFKNDIPFLIDANNNTTKEFLLKLAVSISKNVGFANDDERLHYHLSAIVVSNFTNHLFAQAKKYCDENNIDFRLLMPLIEETVNRMHNYKPAEMQTGPAFRGDMITVQKHIELLNNSPQLQNIYKLMSESIIEFNKK